MLRNLGAGNHMAAAGACSCGHDIRRPLAWSTLAHHLLMCRHLDTNGDGLVSEMELRAALGELGAGGHASAAAQELVGLAGGGGGGGSARGVSFAEWSLFVRRVRPTLPCRSAPCKRTPGFAGAKPAAPTQRSLSPVLLTLCTDPAVAHGLGSGHSLAVLASRSYFEQGFSVDLPPKLQLLTPCAAGGPAARAAARGPGNGGQPAEVPAVARHARTS